MEEARREAKYFMISNPHFTIGFWAKTQPIRDEATSRTLSTVIVKQACPTEDNFGLVTV